MERVTAEVNGWEGVPREGGDDTGRRNQSAGIDEANDTNGGRRCQVGDKTGGGS